jgi:hypothetical protein
MRTLIGICSASALESLEQTPFSGADIRARSEPRLNIRPQPIHRSNRKFSVNWISPVADSSSDMRLSTTFAIVSAIVPFVAAWNIESWTGRGFSGNRVRYTFPANRCSNTSGQLRDNTLSVRAAPGWECGLYKSVGCENYWNYTDSEGWGNIGALQINGVSCYGTQVS